MEENPKDGLCRRRGPRVFNEKDGIDLGAADLIDFDFDSDSDTLVGDEDDPSKAGPEKSWWNKLLENIKKGLQAGLRSLRRFLQQAKAALESCHQKLWPDKPWEKILDAACEKSKVEFGVTMDDVGQACKDTIRNQVPAAQQTQAAGLVASALANLNGFLSSIGQGLIKAKDWVYDCLETAWKALKNIWTSFERVAMKFWRSLKRLSSTVTI